MRKLKLVHACLRRAARGAEKRHEQGLKNKLRQELVSVMAARHGKAVAVCMNAGKNLLPCGEAQRGEAMGELAHEPGQSRARLGRRRHCAQGAVEEVGPDEPRIKTAS